MSLQERTVDGMKMIVSPLPGLDAIDLGNELYAYLAPGMAAGAIHAQASGEANPVAALEATGLAANAMIGRLSNLIPRLLASTIVIAAGSKFELSKGADEINRLLQTSPQALWPLLAFTAEVQFARFFPASVLAGIREKVASLSAAFSQSTSGTGSSTG